MKNRFGATNLPRICVLIILLISAAYGPRQAGAASETAQIQISEPVMDLCTSGFCVFGSEGVIADPDFTVNGNLGSNKSVFLLGRSGTRDVMGGDAGIFGINQKIDGTIVFDGEVILGGGSVVQGDVHAGESLITGVKVDIFGNATAAGDITLGKKSYVHGSNLSFSSPTLFTTVTLPNAKKFAAGTQAVKKPNAGTTTLAPARYGALQLGNSNKLYLSSGDYYFENITAGNQFSLYLNLKRGPINIFVMGDVSLGTDMTVTLVSGTAADVYVETHGTWAMRGGSSWSGAIFAPYGNIEILGSNGVITGRLWSGAKIILDGGTSVICLPCP